MRPKWENKKAVFKLLEERLSEQMTEYTAAIFAGRPPQLTEGQLRVIDPPPGWNRKWDEQTAVEEAKRRGNLWPLARLLEPEPVLKFDADGQPTGFADYYEVNEHVARLKPETWFLIVEFLLGDRSLKTGRKKGERGAPKMSEEGKRKRWGDIIRARDLYEAVIDTLRGEFPERRPKEVSDRTLEFTADKTGVSETTLVEHLKKHRRRRRPSRGA